MNSPIKMSMPKASSSHWPSTFAIQRCTSPSNFKTQTILNMQPMLERKILSPPQPIKDRCWHSQRQVPVFLRYFPKFLSNQNISFKESNQLPNGWVNPIYHWCKYSHVSNEAHCWAYNETINPYCHLHPIY